MGNGGTLAICAALAIGSSCEEDVEFELFIASFLNLPVHADFGISPRSHKT